MRRLNVLHLDLRRIGSLFWPNRAETPAAPDRFTACGPLFATSSPLLPSLRLFTRFPLRDHLLGALKRRASTTDPLLLPKSGSHLIRSKCLIQDGDEGSPHALVNHMYAFDFHAANQGRDYLIFR